MMTPAHNSAPVRVKICGITRLDDALCAAACGADMLGLNFYAASKRYITPGAARDLARSLRAALGADAPLLVGLFVHAVPGEVAEVAALVGLDAAQFSGDETPGDVPLPLPAYFTLRADDPAQASALAARHAVDAGDHLPALLLDALVSGQYGGTGHAVGDAVALAVRAVVPRLMLAGGLTPDNVAARVAAVRPWAVDVASGVEAGVPGVKDAAKMRAFIAAAKG